MGHTVAAFTCAEIKAKVDKLKELIGEYEDASLALATGQIQEYSFDSGQTRQTVTKIDVYRLDQVIDSLYNRLNMLCARYPQCTGGASSSIIVRPAW